MAQARDDGTYSKNLRSTVGAFLRELRDLDAGGELYTRPVVTAMEQSLQVALREIVRLTPTATGDLAGAYRIVMSGNPAKPLRGYMGAIENTEPYAAAVELGADPHMPPVEPIAEWVRAKGLAGPVSRKARKAGTRIGFRDAKGRKRSRRLNVTPEELSMAWAVAKTIERRGTKGAHMFRDGFRAARPAIVLLWQGAIQDIVRRLALRAEGTGP